MRFPTESSTDSGDPQKVDGIEGLRNTIYALPIKWPHLDKNISAFTPALAGAARVSRNQHPFGFD
jgi:hypothetical protein